MGQRSRRIHGDMGRGEDLEGASPRSSSATGGSRQRGDLAVLLTVLG